MPNPKVGIFWFYKGKVIFSHSISVEDGFLYGEAVTGTRDHAEYWEELRKDGKLNVLDESLREEYFSIARGRVVFHKDTGKFSLYHGNNMKKPDLHKVALFFNLPEDRTDFAQDLHYCDLTDSEWNKIF